jgi:hypothetical protein
MSSRKMTPEEIEALRVDLIMAGAVGQNAVKCSKCGNVTHFPNKETGDIQIRDSLFHVDHCVNCDSGSCWG